MASSADMTSSGAEGNKGPEQTEHNKMCLDDLMAACTTIGYDPKKAGVPDSDTKSKSQKKKDSCLAMLDPDVLETDPKKDERDTAYAQHYFGRVKGALQNDQKRFIKFLSLLRDMNKDRSSPIELYADMATLLSGHQDLVDDFAGFLLSFQAVLCGCLVQNSEFSQIREILRKLEIYCETTSTLSYQRTLKMLSRWLSLTKQEPEEASVKERLLSTLKQVPGLMDTVLAYFLDDTMPQSSEEDFECVDLESMPDDRPIDDFEEIVLPKGHEDYNTKLCACFCHSDQEDERLRRRRRHCFSCSLKLYNGIPVAQCGRELCSLKVVYPSEEQEKRAKAKREATQLALAKARARRKLLAKAGKQKGRRLKKGPGRNMKARRRSRHQDRPKTRPTEGSQHNCTKSGLDKNKEPPAERAQVPDSGTAHNSSLSDIKASTSLPPCFLAPEVPSQSDDASKDELGSMTTAVNSLSEPFGMGVYTDKKLTESSLPSDVKKAESKAPSVQNPRLVSILSIPPSVTTRPMSPGRGLLGECARILPSGLSAPSSPTTSLPRPFSPISQLPVPTLRTLAPHTETHSDPSTETSSDPSTETSSDPSTETSSDPSTETHLDPSAEMPLDPSAEMPLDPSAKIPSDPSTESSSDPSTESSSDPSRETPSDPSTETPSDPSTETPSDPSTETPSDPSTESSSDPSTETPPALSTEAPSTRKETDSVLNTCTKMPSSPSTEKAEIPAPPNTQAPSAPCAETLSARTETPAPSAKTSSSPSIETSSTPDTRMLSTPITVTLAAPGNGIPSTPTVGILSAPSPRMFSTPITGTLSAPSPRMFSTPITGTLSAPIPLSSITTSSPAHPPTSQGVHPSTPQICVPARFPVFVSFVPQILPTLPSNPHEPRHKKARVTGPNHVGTPNKTCASQANRNVTHQLNAQAVTVNTNCQPLVNTGNVQSVPSFRQPCPPVTENVSNQNQQSLGRINTHVQNVNPITCSNVSTDSSRAILTSTHPQTPKGSVVSSWIDGSHTTSKGSNGEAFTGKRSESSIGPAVGSSLVVGGNPDLEASMLDTMDMQHLQHLAFSESPSKLGSSGTRFGLINYIEQSNLTAMSTAGGSAGGTVSMAGALRRNLAQEEASKNLAKGAPAVSGSSLSSEDMDTERAGDKGDLNEQVAVENTSTENGRRETGQGLQCTSDLKETTQVVRKAFLEDGAAVETEPTVQSSDMMDESVGEGHTEEISSDQWTEEMDRVLLSEITDTGGIDYSKVHHQMPGKSLQQVEARVRFLVEYIQATSDVDTESEASCCSDMA